jgi:hypothetical protein
MICSIRIHPVMNAHHSDDRPVGRTPSWVCRRNAANGSFTPLTWPQLLPSCVVCRRTDLVYI